MPVPTPLDVHQSRQRLHRAPGRVVSSARHAAVMRDFRRRVRQHKQGSPEVGRRFRRVDPSSVAVVMTFLPAPPRRVTASPVLSADCD